MSTKPYSIAIAGLGTVGIGLIQLIEKNADLLTMRAGRPIAIRAISARNRTKDRGADLSAYDWIDDPMDLADLGDVDAIIELIGGDSGPALALARKTLGAGKDFITANKALLAIHGAELAALAEEKGAGLAYEAAVAGAVPVIKVVRESLAGNRISKIGGILNGTCNFILSAMESTGAAYADVLKEAQDLGYAEADPTTDVGGFDAAHKLTLLAALAFGHAPDFDACSVSGIEGISDKALTYADRLGYRLRLVGLAEAAGKGSRASVQTLAVPKDSTLGSVTGSHNAVQIMADQAQSIFLRGPGAGRAETASAVGGDIVDLARGHGRPAFGQAMDGAQDPRTPSKDSAAHVHLCIMTIRDEPGVMAHLTQILAAQGVSVDQLLQPGGQDGQSDLVLVTHPSSEDSTRAAFAALDADPATLQPVETYRVETFGA